MHVLCGSIANRRPRVFTTSSASSSMSVSTYRPMPHMQSTKGERLIAVFEAAKGAIVLLVGLGLLAVVHQDAQSVAEELVYTLHLNPAKRYPNIFLQAAERYSDVRLWLLAALAFGYAALRLAEAYGLWFGRRWAEWVAVLTGGFYVLIEIDAIWHHVSWIKVGVLAVNVGIVVYLGWSLRPRGRGPSGHVATPHGYRPAQTLSDGNRPQRSLVSEGM